MFLIYFYIFLIKNRISHYENFQIPLKYKEQGDLVPKRDIWFIPIPKTRPENLIIFIMFFAFKKTFFGKS